MSWQGQKIITKNVITGISWSFYFYGHQTDAGAWSELTWIRISFFLLLFFFKSMEVNNNTVWC